MLHSEAAALNAELQISAVNLKKEKASTGLKQDHLSTQNTNLRNEVSRLEKTTLIHLSKSMFCKRESILWTLR